MKEPLRFAVLGDPIEHSRSPAIHGAAMRHLGIEGSYEARRAGPAELALAVDEMRRGTLDGLNVTMPLKREAAMAADLLTEEARAGQSVNTLRVRAGVVEGHSTDVIAFRAALADPRFDAHAPILILGSGGAAAAALIGAEGRHVYLAARNEIGAQALVDLAPTPVDVIRFGATVAGAIVVNATSLGMNGETLPGEVADLASGIIDLPYGNEPTPIVLRAMESGTPVMDGVEFLVWQAAASFEWWTDVAAPFEVMLQAARKP